MKQDRLQSHTPINHQAAEIRSVHIPTTLAGCTLRSWRHSDKADLIRNANNRKVWRNLTEMFPHPYTEADADVWLRIANAEGRSLQLAIEFKGVAIGGACLQSGGKARQHNGQPNYDSCTHR